MSNELSRRAMNRPLLITGFLLAASLSACKKDAGGALGEEQISERQLEMATAEANPTFADTAAAKEPAIDYGGPEQPITSTPAPSPTVLPAPAPRTVTQRRTPTPPPVAAAAPEPTVLPAPVPAAPTLLTVASGTSLGMVASARACAPNLQVGSELRATVDRDYDVDGRVVIAGGSPVTLRVQQVEPNRIVLVPVRVRAVDGDHALSGVVGVAVLDTVKAPAKARTGKGALLGALAGAAIGAAVGKDTKGAVLGGAVGAAAGASAGAATAGSHVCLPERARLAVQLDAPIRISAN